MKEYLLGVMIISLVGSIIMSTAPRGGSAGALKLICALCAVCVIAMPFLGLVSDRWGIDGVRDIFAVNENDERYYDEIYNSQLTEVQLLNAEKTLKKQIIQGFSFDDDSFDVNIILSSKSDEKSIEKVELIIYTSGVAIDPHAVEKYIYDCLECPCETIYLLR